MQPYFERVLLTSAFGRRYVAINSVTFLRRLSVIGLLAGTGAGAVVGTTVGTAVGIAGATGIAGAVGMAGAAVGTAVGMAGAVGIAGAGIGLVVGFGAVGVVELSLAMNSASSFSLLKVNSSFVDGILIGPFFLIA